jgi:hypothetical protein
MIGARCSPVLREDVVEALAPSSSSVGVGTAGASSNEVCTFDK